MIYAPHSTLKFRGWHLKSCHKEYDCSSFTALGGKSSENNIKADCLVKFALLISVLKARRKRCRFAVKDYFYRDHSLIASLAVA